MSAPSSAKGSPTQGDSQATSFNTPGAWPDLAEIQAQQLAQAGSIADLQTKVGNLDTKSDSLSADMNTMMATIMVRLDRWLEHRPTSAEEAAAAKAAAKKAVEAKREQEAQKIDKEVKRLQQLAREKRAGNSPKADQAGHRDPEQQLAEHRVRPTDPTRDQQGPEPTLAAQTAQAQNAHAQALAHPADQTAQDQAQQDQAPSSTLDPTNTHEGYALEFLHTSSTPS